MKKTVKLVSTKFLKMKLTEMYAINRDREFSDSWLTNQKRILLLLTLGGSAVVLLWQIFDKYYIEAFDSRLPWLRWITIATYALNLLTALMRKSPRAIKQHLIAGFYLGSVFCTLLAMFTGASESPYWFGLFFIIVAWFVLVPYNFREMIIHSLLFLIIFISGLAFQPEFTIVPHEMGKIVFLYSGALFVSFFAAYIRNQLDATNFKIKKELENKNRELQSSNEELKSEIESHKNTTQKLTENQQFLDNILSNAPIVIWSIDLNGIFTYSQYTGDNEIEPGGRIGKSAFEVYKGTEVENFLRKVIKDEIQNDIIQVGSITYDTRVSPIYNEEGEKTGYLGVSMDITDRIRTENELKKFRLVLDQTPGAVFIMDKYSNFEYINPQFTNLSGYTEEDLLHKNINDTLYKGISEIPESRKEVIKNLSEGKTWQGELLTINKNGTKYWANTIASPFKNNSGMIDGFIVIQQDITERLNFEKTIRESEAKYKALVENSQDGIIITQNGKFKFVNDAMCRMLGYTTEEFYQMNGTDIIPVSDRDRINKIHAERMAGKINSLNYSMQLVAKDKSLIDVELQSSTVEYEGKPAGFMTLHDVTESKSMQQALEESEKKYRELTEMLPQTVYELDKNGNILYFNQTGFEQFGIDESDLGTPSFNFIIPEQHAAMKANFHKTISEKRNSYGNKYTALRKNGTTFPAITFASPIISGDEVIGIRGLILNMSEHEAMENAVRESEEKYRSLIDKATDGIVITQMGLIKFANPAMCSMMQYSQEELLDQPYLNYVIKEDHQVMVDYHKRRMEGENFTSIYRSRFVPKDGKIITMELNARTSEYNGQPAAFIIIRNITERLKIEQELQQAKTELEKLNSDLEKRVLASSEKLTEANTQLIRLQKENLQSQFEVLRQQVNPHFLFNSLNVLTSLIKLEPDLAEQFTEHLSKVYRYVLENKDNDLVSLHTELDFLDAYIFLLNIRFMDKIVVVVNIMESKRECQILPLALQLLIENAIKHNAMSKRNPLKIDIFIDANNVLHVENNLQERESHMVSTGVGLRNITHRYHLLEMPEPEFIKTETKFIACVPLKC